MTQPLSSNPVSSVVQSSSSNAHLSNHHSPKPSVVDVKLNRLKAKRAVLLNREEIATQQDRRRRTRTLIQLGGLLSVVGLTDRFGIVLGDDLQERDGDGRDGKDRRDDNKGDNGSQDENGEGQGSGDDGGGSGTKNLTTDDREGNSQGDTISKDKTLTNQHQTNQDKAATLLGLLLSVIEQLPETVDTETLKQKGIRFLKMRSAERHY